jgi:DNA-binding GntR family transcriptional regulator
MDQIVNANLDTFTHYVRLNENFHFGLMRLAKSPMLERSLNHLNTLPFAGPSKLVFARVTAPEGTKLLMQGHQEHHASWTPLPASNLPSQNSWLAIMSR